MQWPTSWYLSPFLLKENNSSAPITSTALCPGFYQLQVTTPLHTRGPISPVFCKASFPSLPQHSLSDTQGPKQRDGPFWKKELQLLFALYSLPAVGTFVPTDKPFSLTSTVYDKSCILFSINSFIHIHCPYFICVCKRLIEVLRSGTFDVICL